jgi:hypothetical protein
MAGSRRPYVVEIPVSRGKVLFQTVDNHVEMIVYDEEGNNTSVDMDLTDRKAILDFLPMMKAR